jgi:putative membrane protein
MKIKTFGLGCLLAVSALCFSTARAADASTVSAGDKSFVMKAAQGGMLEVQTGQMAQTQGSAQDVKDFGSKMVEDHGKANDELKALASSKGIDLPAQLDAKHQKLVDDLKSKSGADFDTAYLALMNKAHGMDDKLFMKEASSGSDPDLKAFADKTDKVVKMHIQMLNDIKSKAK